MEHAQKKSPVRLVIRSFSKHAAIPSRYYFSRWIKLALEQELEKKEVHIRIVNEQESRSLNQAHRRKNKPANVLSYPFEAPPGLKSPLLGDLVLCAPLIAKEAKAEKKNVLAHWAHMVIHGVLHLLGYDHIKKKDAAVMEALEIQLLKKLGYDDPYTDLTD